MAMEHEILDPPVKIGEIVGFQAWDNSTRSYVWLEGKIVKRFDEPGKLSAYLILADNVIYPKFGRKSLMLRKEELF